MRGRITAHKTHLDELQKANKSALERIEKALTAKQTKAFTRLECPPVDDDWRKRSSARAQIRIAIEDTLDEGLPRTYRKELYNTKCEVLFEHVYESYQGDGSSVYAQPE